MTENTTDKVVQTGPAGAALAVDSLQRLQLRSVVVRAIARLRAGKFDRMLAVGVSGPDESPLAAHATRLTSRSEREALARTLRCMVREAHGESPLLSSRIPVHRANIDAAEDLIDKVTLRLHAPQPVSARGTARLRVLLTDGAGPLYRCGRGDLVGKLGAVLAAM